MADVLSQVLRAVRLTGAVFFDVTASAPWVAEQPPPEVILPRLLPGAGQLIAYHVVTYGQCFASIIGKEPIALQAGEIIVFPKGDPHALSSSPGMRATSVAPGLDTGGERQLPFPINCGGNGPVSARLICGFLACDAQPFNPLFENLPPVIRAADIKPGDETLLGEFMRLAMIESARERPGGESMLARLSELMFIEVVRRYLQSLSAEDCGWLAGLRDPFVGKALALMHASPARNWTIEDLARKVGLSRSLLADRFASLVGIPPMHYLGKWRIQIAAGLLSSGSTDIASIAAQAGYGSEAAFSRAFKKMVGVPPSAWRRRHENPHPIAQTPGSTLSGD